MDQVQELYHRAFHSFCEPALQIHRTLFHNLLVLFGLTFIHSILPSRPRTPSCKSVRRTWTSVTQNRVRPLSLNLFKLLTNIETANISLKSTYEPDMMPDFNPSLNLGGARLVQQALFDENADLVPPWEAPSVFRKGALVAVEAQLSVYHFVEDKKPSHVCCSADAVSIMS